MGRTRRKKERRKKKTASPASRQTKPGLIAGSSGTRGRRDVDKQAMRGDNEALSAGLRQQQRSGTL